MAKGQDHKTWADILSQIAPYLGLVQFPPPPPVLGDSRDPAAVADLQHRVAAQVEATQLTFAL